MKSILDKTTRDELINRINRVDENMKPLWGKMNVYQMVRHCGKWEEWILAQKQYKQSFIGRLFGPMVLKNIMKDEKPLKRNTPTLPEFRINKLGQRGDLSAEKANWIALIESYRNFSHPGFVHSFFGKMTNEQIGYLVYKHADHHLRQFNC
jgi:hypothetical protein